jgi:hypothetical protein
LAGPLVPVDGHVEDCGVIAEFGICVALSGAGVPCGVVPCSGVYGFEFGIVVVVDGAGVVAGVEGVTGLGAVLGIAPVGLVVVVVPVAPPAGALKAGLAPASARANTALHAE